MLRYRGAGLHQRKEDHAVGPLAVAEAKAEAMVEDEGSFLAAGHAKMFERRLAVLR